MVLQAYNFVFDSKRWIYRLTSAMVYHSKRYKKTVTCEEGMETNGASGPANDIITRGWFIHDKLCEKFQWDDGTPCSAWQSSMVLHDILEEEGRWVRSITWFVATFPCMAIRQAILKRRK